MFDDQIINAINNYKLTCNRFLDVSRIDELQAIARFFLEEYLRNENTVPIRVSALLHERIANERAYTKEVGVDKTRYWLIRMVEQIADELEGGDF